MLKSKDYLEFAKQKTQDFTRNRKMPFVKLMLFMLNMVRCSTQTCLDRFFDLIGQSDARMTQQSFSEARKKIRWEAFQKLFKGTMNHIYTGYYETWHGYRVSATDGSKLQMPDDRKLRDYFGTAGKGNTAATAQASALYNVFNNVVIDAQIEPIKIGERELALRHINALSAMPSFNKELIIYDRGYASYDMMEALVIRGINYLMRVKRKFSVELDQLEEGDHIVKLRDNKHRDVHVRAIKFPLPSGEIETLITNIMDKRMGAKAFKELYFKRWPVETKYDEIKNKLDVENFSGRTVDAIRQDFFITMYMANAVSVACWEAQDAVDKSRKQKDNKYVYHVNVNHAIGSMKDHFILAVLEPDPVVRGYKVERILMRLIEHVVPRRPDRSNRRNQNPRKAKFRHNRKSNC
jgi:hypothetical protein